MEHSLEDCVPAVTEEAANSVHRHSIRTYLERRCGER